MSELPARFRSGFPKCPATGRPWRRRRRLTRLGAPALAFALATIATGSDGRPSAPLGNARPEAGRFLVASEKMTDPRFRETVILLADHDANGSLGLILNRPSGVPLHRVFEEVPGLASRSEVLHLGGPVEIGGLLYLLRSGKPVVDAHHVFADVYLSGDPERLKRALARAEPTKGLRVYTGYAGWGPQQLPHEISRGDWHILRGDPEVIFRSDLSDLWQKLTNDLSGIAI